MSQLECLTKELNMGQSKEPGIRVREGFAYVTGKEHLTMLWSEFGRGSRIHGGKADSPRVKIRSSVLEYLVGEVTN